MLNLNLEVRRRLAKLVESPTIKKLLEMESEELDQILEDQLDGLEKRGANPTVALAYQLVAPLYQENQAVMTFLAEPANFHLSGALPDLATVQEAVDVATAEYRLTPEQQKELESMLAELIQQ